MIYKKIKGSQFTLVIFNKTIDEWEKVRKKCLEEPNWLRDNYIEKNCVVEDHDIFCIAYETSTNKPYAFGGIYNNGRYPDEVARCLNRYYVFPEFRKISLHEDLCRYVSEIAIPAMIDASPINRKFHFMSWQMRTRNYVGEQKWFKYTKLQWGKFGWTPVDKLVQVVKGENPECFQNIMFKKYSDYDFEDWNPRCMNFDDYFKLFVADSEQ